jgi:hypothetical protein
MMKQKLIAASLVLLLAVPFLFGGCSTITGGTVTPAAGAPGEGFEIYLAADNITLESMGQLSQVKISDTPVIVMDDILAYCWETHEIKISGVAYARIAQGPKAITGPFFIACVDRQPIYWGKLWTFLSSSMPDSVYIMRPFTAAGADGGVVTQIELGYMSNAFYGKDPRNDAAIHKTLEKAGKLTGPLVSYPQPTETYVPEGFAIYLTKDPGYPPTQNQAYKWPDLEDTPIIGLKDIVSYKMATHDITLTPEAYQRLLDLDIPVNGRSFTLCCDKQPSRGGAFWSPVSSVSYDGYVIVVPPLPGAGLPPDTVRLGHGYPEPVLIKSDIRNNVGAMLSLEKAGKLIGNLVNFTYPPSEPVAPEGFAVYLTADNVSRFDMEFITDIKLADEPVFSSDDIISYDWATHEIVLTDKAYARFNQLPRPQHGLVYVACVDKAPVYWGVIWANWHGYLFDGAIIGHFPYLTAPNTIAIQVGAVGSFHSRGDDPRSNPIIKAALEKAGKLKD